MLTPHEIFILASLCLNQEDPNVEATVIKNPYFAEDIANLEAENYIRGEKLLAKGYNSIHTDPRMLNSKQLGFRLVATLETLYNRRDLTALKYIPTKIKEQMISSLAASLNSQPEADVVAEFQRTTPKEEVVVEHVQEEAVVESKPKKSRKKA